MQVLNKSKNCALAGFKTHSSHQSECAKARKLKKMEIKKPVKKVILEKHQIYEIGQACLYASSPY